MELLGLPMALEELRKFTETRASNPAPHNFWIAMNFFCWQYKLIFVSLRSFFDYYHKYIPDTSSSSKNAVLCLDYSITRYLQELYYFSYC